MKLRITSISEVATHEIMRDPLSCRTKKDAGMS
jgi:hypothetical protein